MAQNIQQKITQLVSMGRIPRIPTHPKHLMVILGLGMVFGYWVFGHELVRDPLNTLFIFVILIIQIEFHLDRYNAANTIHSKVREKLEEEGEV